MDNSKIIFISLLFIFTIVIAYNLLNKNPKRRGRICRKYSKYEENFVENLEPTAAGQIILSDPTGNLATFNVGSGKTLVSDSVGNITTITTGKFDGLITANGGISVTDLNANGSLTASGLNTKLINAPVSANTWLQVNSNGNAQNGVAVQNALSIVDGAANNGGLLVGKWNDSSNSPGNGNIFATGNITAAGNSTAGQFCIGTTCMTAADLAMVKKLTGGFKLIGHTGSLYHNFDATNGNWGGNPFYEFTSPTIKGHNGDYDTWKLY